MHSVMSKSLTCTSTVHGEKILWGMQSCNGEHARKCVHKFHGQRGGLFQVGGRGGGCQQLSNVGVKINKRDEGRKECGRIPKCRRAVE